MKRYITLEETAEFLSLPLSMIYRMSSDGRLPGKIIWGARTVRIDREILEAALRDKVSHGEGEPVGTHQQTPL